MTVRLSEPAPPLTRTEAGRRSRFPLPTVTALLPAPADRLTASTPLYVIVRARLGSPALLRVTVVITDAPEIVPVSE